MTCAFFFYCHDCGTRLILLPLEEGELIRGKKNPFDLQELEYDARLAAKMV
jgi:hypothetical protein